MFSLNSPPLQSVLFFFLYKTSNHFDITVLNCFFLFVACGNHQQQIKTFRFFALLRPVCMVAQITTDRPPPAEITSRVLKQFLKTFSWFWGHLIHRNCSKNSGNEMEKYKISYKRLNQCLKSFNLAFDLPNIRCWRSADDLMKIVNKFHLANCQKPTDNLKLSEH